MKDDTKALFVCYPKCTTCKKAGKWLDTHGIAYENRNIKEERPTEQELREWAQKSARPFKRFFNTSGLAYRSLGLSEKLKGMEADEIFRLLATDGMLVKRPILVTAGKVLVGFDEAEWENFFTVNR